MKSLKTTAEETPKTTLAVVAMVLVGITTLLVDSATVLGIPSETVKWISFGSAAVTYVLNVISNNMR